MAGFSLGSASGLLKLSDKFDTKEGESLLKKSQDTSKSLSKVNEATVGQFNETTKTEAIEEKKSDETKKTLVEETKEALKAAADKAADAAKKGADAVKNAPQTVAKQMAKATAFVNGIAADPNMPPGTDDRPLTQRLGDMAADAVGLGDNETYNEVVDSLKDNFCAAQPFPQCRTCPNRPKNSGSQIPDFMKMISDTIKALEAGLESLAMAICGCPGLVGGVKGALLNGGNFTPMIESMKSAAMSSAINTAVSVGSSKVLGALGSMMPGDLKKSLQGSVGKLFNNSGPNSYNNIMATMTGLAVAGNSLFTAASAAKNGNILGAYSMLKSGAIANPGNGYMMRKNGTITMLDTTPSQALFNSISQCSTSAAALSSSVKVPGILNRGSYSSRQLVGLPGTTVSDREFKNAYACYYRKRANYSGGVVYKQRGTTVRTFASRSRVLI